MTWSELFPPAAAPVARRWVNVPAPVGVTLKQISVGSANAIWVLDTAGSPWKWNGSAWEKKAGTVSTISAAPDGTQWATNPPDANRVLRWTGTGWDASLPAGMTYVSVGNANNI